MVHKARRRAACLSSLLLFTTATPFMSATQVHDEEKRSSSHGDEEKHPDRFGVETTVDSVDGDEALKLVGLERDAVFTEEYNQKLKRKLVRESEALVDCSQARVHRTGSSLPFALRCTLRSSCE